MQGPMNRLGSFAQTPGVSATQVGYCPVILPSLAAEHSLQPFRSFNPVKFRAAKADIP
jgi:hypothetical protein